MIPYGRISGYLMEARELLDRHNHGSVVVAAILAHLDAAILLTCRAHHRQKRD